MMTARDLLGFRFSIDSFMESVSIRKPDERNMKRLKDILQKHSVMMRRPSPESIQDVYNLFLKAIAEDKISQFESPRLCRKLAWALIDIAKEQEHLDIAVEMIDMNCSPSCMLGIFDALLRLWGTENTELLQLLLKKHLAEYDGKRKFLRILKLNQDYYCNKDSIAKAVVSMQRQQIQLSDVWEWLGLPEHMHNYSYFGDLGLAFVQLNSSINKPFLEDVVRFLKKHNYEKKIKEIVSFLIEKLGMDAEEHLREPIQTYALQKWSDPRIAGGNALWSDISKTARSIFIRWLAKEDLLFFFDVVARACNDEKFADRKYFWLSYIEHISLCRPILRKDAELYLTSDPLVRQYLQKRNPAKLLGGTNDQHVFIIQMGDYIFIEFSTAGACYVYHKDNCPFLLNKMEYRMDVFRNRDKASYRQVHIGLWEYRLSEWIQWNLGISSTKH